MRIGPIGVGRIGAFPGSTLGRLPQVDSLIITDADLGRARDVAWQLGVTAAEAREPSRQRDEPVVVAEVRQ